MVLDYIVSHSLLSGCLSIETEIVDSHLTYLEVLFSPDPEIAS